MGEGDKWGTMLAILQGRASRFSDVRVPGSDLGVAFESGVGVLTLGATTCEMGPVAHRQLAKLAGIPGRVYERLWHAPSGTAREDAGRVVTNLFHERCNDRAFLVRVLAGEKTNTRTAESLLDARTCVVEHHDLLVSVTDWLHSLTGGSPSDWGLSVDGLLTVRYLTPRLQDCAVGDTVQAGVQVVHSDLLGTFPEVRLRTYRLACENGMVVANPDDYGIRNGHRRSMVTGRHKVFGWLHEELNGALEAFGPVVLRMQDAQQRMVSKASEALAAVIDEFKVDESVHGVLFGQFEDLKLTEPISLAEFSNRITQAAKLCGPVEQDLLERLGSRVLTLPLDRLDLSGAGERSSSPKYRVLRFVDVEGDKATATGGE